jgi:hypothetical protein
MWRDDNDERHPGTPCVGNAALAGGAGLSSVFALAPALSPHGHLTLDRAQAGFLEAGKFLRNEQFFSSKLLPYAPR